jgi:alpha-soluble NSF attachment protein
VEVKEVDLVFCNRYDRAIDIYENVARQSMNNNLLKYSVKGYLLNAGLCQICGKDIVAVHNAIENYQVTVSITLMS